MKRILSLVLVLILVMSSVLLVACDDKTDEPAATTAATTTAAPEEDGGDKPAADPVEVETAAGMTVAELFEKFTTEFEAAETYDVAMVADVADASGDYKVTYDLKLGDESLYMSITRDDQNITYWVVDGVMYGMNGEEKLKMTVESFDTCPVLPQFAGLLESMFAYKDKDAVLAMLDDVKLYSYKGEFYYERALTADEADYFDLEAETAKETLYFNAQGKAIRKVMDDGATRFVIDIKGYGTTVTIKAPDDPDSFVNEEWGGGGAQRPEGDVDPEVYDIYLDIYDRIERAEVYSLMVMVEYETALEYAIDANGDEYVCAYADGEYSEMWMSGARAYVRQNGEGDVIGTEASALQSTFDSVRVQKDAISNYRMASSELAHLSIEYGDEGSVIRAVYVAGEGVEIWYTISFANDYSGIAITRVIELNGEDQSCVAHAFTDLDSSTFDVEMPA